MRIPFRLVDVFTERPLAGNQLCVVSDGGEVDPETMQALAQEIGFSETTFVLESGGDRYRMRIFTPGSELPFAGHPTLGTAYTLVSENRVSSPVTQSVPAGEIEVDVDLVRGFARMRQLPPTFGKEVTDRELLAAANGLSPDRLHPDHPAQVVSTGLAHLIVPARDADAVAAAEREPRALQTLLEAAGTDAIYLFAIDGDGKAKARMFDTTRGIGEDPATGSAAGPLGAYLAERGAGGMPGTVAIRQGEELGRPSVLHVEVEPDGDSWKVFVGGGVQIVGKGAFE
ncbi:MAG: PhzF family phenazine biosynthesis protein, partial [Actinomycetota bacterium]|nr:PhzF family phenazine biosynthesis protein [Actinomycetota bacterium]